MGVKKGSLISRSVPARSMYVRSTINTRDSVSLRECKLAIDGIRLARKKSTDPEVYASKPILYLHLQGLEPWTP